MLMLIKKMMNRNAKEYSFEWTDPDNANTFNFFFEESKIYVMLNFRDHDVIEGSTIRNKEVFKRECKKYIDEFNENHKQKLDFTGVPLASVR